MCRFKQFWFYLSWHKQHGNIKQMSEVIWVVCNKLTTVWAPTKNCSLAEFSGTYGVTKYGSGWRKDVINKCLEFACEVDRMLKSSYSYNICETTVQMCVYTFKLIWFTSDVICITISKDIIFVYTLCVCVMSKEKGSWYSAIFLYHVNMLLKKCFLMVWDVLNHTYLWTGIIKFHTFYFFSNHACTYLIDSHM